MKNVGIVGCGNVASEILKSNLYGIEKIFLYDIDVEKMHLIPEIFTKYKFIFCNSIDELIEKSDIIIESASIIAAEKILSRIKSFPKKEFLILSVGGLVKKFNMYQYLINKNYKIHVPSGAIAGTDALEAVKNVEIKRIKLKTTKPTNSLLSATYFKTNKKLYNKMLKEKTLNIFTGNVFDAIKFFPQNINVAATLAVISGKPKKVEVEIYAKKNLNKNIHEIEIISSAGKVYTRTENIPSLNNPKTSYLAALSLISSLKKILL